MRRVRLLRAGLPQQGPHHHPAAPDRPAPRDRPGAGRGDTALLERLEQEYQYDAIDTCAVDGMCQTACPVLINTGDLTRRLRAEQRGRVEQTAMEDRRPTLGRLHPSRRRRPQRRRSRACQLPVGATTAGRTLLGNDTVPAWSAELPGGGTRRRTQPAAAPVAIYFPACISTMFGAADDGLRGCPGRFPCPLPSERECPSGSPTASRHCAAAPRGNPKDSPTATRR